MNFLSHFYFDAQTDDPWLVFGIALPDLADGFNKNYKMEVMNHATGLLDRESASVKRGVERHYEVDKIFHNGKHFQEATGFIKQVLKNADLQSIEKHVYFLGHIYYEMMLDRILIELYPNLPVNYYRLLENISQSAMKGYFQHIELEHRFEELFARFRGFLNHKYLLRYSGNEPLVFALCRVYRRVSAVEVAYSDQLKLQHSIEEVEQYVRPLIHEIFNEVKTKLK